MFFGPCIINIVTSPLLEKEGSEWESIASDQLDNDAKKSDSSQLQDHYNDRGQIEPEDRAPESDDDGSRTIHAGNDGDSSELSFLDSEDEHRKTASGVGQVQPFGTVDTDFPITRRRNSTRFMHGSEENESISSCSSSDDESGSDYAKPAAKQGAKKQGRRDARMKNVERSRDALHINDPDFKQIFNNLRFPYFPERLEVGTPISNNPTSVEQKTGRNHKKSTTCEGEPFEGGLRQAKKYYDAS